MKYKTYLLPTRRSVISLTVAALWLSVTASVWHAAAAGEERHPAASAMALSRLGGAGLIAMPTARFPELSGVFAGGAVGGGKDRDLFVGAWPMPWLELVLRRTVGRHEAGGDRLEDQALDLRVWLGTESRWSPALAIGWRDLADGGTSSEYVVFSKRLYNLDFSLGLGWGRLAESESLPGLPGGLGRGAQADRKPDEGGPSDWFTGDAIGVFGGVAYHLGDPDVTFALEYDSRRRRAERTFDPSVSTGMPLSVGISYRPTPWIDFSVGLERGDTGFLRLAVRLGLEDRKPRAFARSKSVKAHAGRTAAPAEQGYRQPADPVAPVKSTGATGHKTVRRSVNLAGRGAGAGEAAFPPAPAIGAAALTALSESSALPETVTVIAHQDGFAPTKITLLGRDLARVREQHGSPEELWQKAEIIPLVASSETEAEVDPAAPLSLGTPYRLLIAPRLQVGLNEPEAAPILRALTDVMVSTRLAKGLVAEGGLRLDLADTLDRMDRRARAADAVRSDVAHFADGFPASLNRAQLGWAVRPHPSWYGLVSVGVVEEMFAGVGVEALYRPFRSRWNVGAEMHQLWKRRPRAWPSLRTDSGRLSGHATVSLDSADARRTVMLSVGRYLGRDWGASLDLTHRFDRGWVLGTSITATNGVDAESIGNDPLGPFFAFGLSLTIPLGMVDAGLGPVRFAPTIEAGTLGRDAGQRVERATTLRSLTDATSYGRIGSSWPRLFETGTDNAVSAAETD